MRPYVPRHTDKLTRDGLAAIIYFMDVDHIPNRVDFVAYATSEVFSPQRMTEAEVSWDLSNEANHEDVP